MLNVNQANGTTYRMDRNAGCDVADYFSVTPKRFVVIEKGLGIGQRKINQALYYPELLLFFQCLLANKPNLFLHINCKT